MTRHCNFADVLDALEHVMDRPVPLADPVYLAMDNARARRLAEGESLEAIRRIVAAGLPIPDWRPRWTSTMLSTP